MCFLQFSLAALVGSLLSQQWQNRGAGGFPSFRSCGPTSCGDLSPPDMPVVLPLLFGRSHTASPQSKAFKSHRQNQRHRFPQLLFSNFVTPDVALVPQLRVAGIQVLESTLLSVLLSTRALGNQD